MKKFVAILLASLMMLSLVACGNKDDVVVAEATGHTSHGYEVEVLYQEYGNGDVKVNVCFHAEELGVPVGITYLGTVTKGVDADGDPLVTLDVTGFEGPEMDGFDLSFGYDNPTTNTYDEKAGTYTLVFPISIFGFADKEVTLEVAPTEAPTDAAAWFLEYGIEDVTKVDYGTEVQ